MKKYVCDVCGWVYDPEVGDPEGGIAPGTAFEDIPDDWVCPLCGVGKTSLVLLRNKPEYPDQTESYHPVPVSFLSFNLVIN